MSFSAGPVSWSAQLETFCLAEILFLFLVSLRLLPRPSAGLLTHAAFHPSRGLLDGDSPFKKRDSAALSEQQPPCAIEAVAAPRNVHVVLIALYACSRSGGRAPSRLPPTVLPAVKVFFSPLADPKSRTTCSGGSRLLFKVDGFPRANHRLNGQPLSGRREPVALCTLHRHRFNGLASLMSDGRAVSAEQLAAGITLHQSNNTSVENTKEIQYIKNE